MGISYGPSIATSGLIFHYDMGNTSKSFKGKPTTNLNSEDIPDLEQIGPPTLTQYSSPTPIGTTAYTVTDSSTSNYQYIRRLGVATIPDDTSTYYLSLYVRKQAGAERFGINWSFVGGGTPINNNSRFNTQTGVAIGSGTGGGSVVDLGEWWRWIVTASNNATGNTSLDVNIYPAAGQNGSDDPTATGTVVISALQVETGSFATPYVNGTRSNTQAIVDLTGSVTATTGAGLIYNADNTFSFEGGTSSSSHINLGDYDIPTQRTVEVWFKSSTTNQTGQYIGLVAKDAVGNIGQVYLGSNQTNANIRWGSIGSGEISYTTSDLEDPSQYFHYVGTYDASGTDALKLYRNSVLVKTGDSTNNPVTNDNNLYIGTRVSNLSHAFAGDIPIVRIYNRALSAAEVAQNFNASRARFGI